MQKLWAGSRRNLGQGVRQSDAEARVTQRLHLIGGLVELLSRWREAARVKFMAAQRQLGIASDLERLMTELDGILSANSGTFPSAQDLRRRVTELHHSLGR
jgi:hypothetical protein